MRISTKLKQAISVLGTRAQTEAIKAWERHSLRGMLAPSTAQLVSKAGPQIKVWMYWSLSRQQPDGQIRCGICIGSRTIKLKKIILSQSPIKCNRRARTLMFRSGSSSITSTKLVVIKCQVTMITQMKAFQTVWHKTGVLASGLIGSSCLISSIKIHQHQPQCLRSGLRNSECLTCASRKRVTVQEETRRTRRCANAWERAFFLVTTEQSTLLACLWKTSMINLFREVSYCFYWLAKEPMKSVYNMRVNNNYNMEP